MLHEFLTVNHDELVKRCRAKRVPYKVARAPNGDSAFSVRGKMLSPQEVSAQVLLKLTKAAEDSDVRERGIPRRS